MGAALPPGLTLGLALPALSADGPGPHLADTLDDTSRQLLDAITVPVYAHRGAQILHANPPLLRLTGYTLAELQQRDHTVLAGEAEREALRRYGDTCLGEPGEPPAMALQMRHAQGDLRPTEITARRLLLAGQPGVVVTCQDLSDIEHVQGTMLNLSQMLHQIINGGPLATFVIDTARRVTHWNLACEHMTQVQRSDMLGSTQQWRAFYPRQRPLLADLIVRGTPTERLLTLFDGELRPSELVDGGYEGEAFVPKLGGSGRWLRFNAAPLHDASGALIGAVQTMQDVTQRHLADQELLRHRHQLEHLVEERSAELRATVDQLNSNLARLQETNQKLEDAQNQLLQQDKMASVGQLAAGVAHEINNPIGFVGSNLQSLKRDVAGLLQLIDAYQANDAHRAGDAADAGAALAARSALDQVKTQVEIDYLREDLPQLLRESEDGLARVKRIVQDLKDFSRVDQSDWQEADLNAGLESTLNVVMHEVKYKATVIRRLQPLPLVRCLAAQLNQVFMNLIVNASQAIQGSGTITLCSGTVAATAEAPAWVWIEVADTGCGMSEDVVRRVFEPFFTTKPVGKGTGLGLSLSFSIVQRHGGAIRVKSTPGAGSAFTVWVPVDAKPCEGVAASPPPEG